MVVVIHGRNKNLFFRQKANHWVNMGLIYHGLQMHTLSTSLTKAFVLRQKGNQAQEIFLEQAAGLRM
jgi:hypothetical protein